MVVSQKVKRLNVGILARLNGGLDRPNIVTQMGCASGGDTGKDAGFSGLTHGF